MSYRDAAQTCYLNPPQMGHALSHHDTEFDGRPFQARQARQSLSSKRDTTPWPHEVRQAVEAKTHSLHAKQLPTSRNTEEQTCHGGQATGWCRRVLGRGQVLARSPGRAHDLDPVQVPDLGRGQFSQPGATNLRPKQKRYVAQPTPSKGQLDRKSPHATMLQDLV